MNWKRQSLSTHFAGCRFDRDYVEEVLDFFPNIVVFCPISHRDTFQDGVYFRKDKGTFVRLEGIWYSTPKLNSMFEYRQFCLLAYELLDEEKKAINLISRTKYATPLQMQLAEGLCSNSQVKRIRLDMKLMYLRYKKENKT